MFLVGRDGASVLEKMVVYRCFVFLSLSVLEVKSVGMGVFGWKGWSICVRKDGYL